MKARILAGGICVAAATVLGCAGQHGATAGSGSAVASTASGPDPGVKHPHDGGDTRCRGCHAANNSLPTDRVSVCARCHGWEHKQHPVSVVQKNPAKGLPLAAGGLLVCHTCHDPHARMKGDFGLRMNADEMCVRCHTGHH